MKPAPEPRPRPRAEVAVLGVDFSGAAPDNNTWATLGRFCEGVLELCWCRPVGRQELAGVLLDLPGDAVVALDFPFSVPQKFANFLRPQATSMPDLWQEAAQMELIDFRRRRDEFVQKNSEHFRVGDLYHTGCFSCLHNTRPNMVPMTFHGMRMLADLWQKTGCRVPPLSDGERTGPLMLESMPGAVLKALNLRDKGYKTGKNTGHYRREILCGLEKASGIKLSNLASFVADCLRSDDCLDSVVATVTAALWSQDDSMFRKPLGRPVDLDTFEEELGRPVSPHRRSRVALPCRDELEVARLEGWLYAPQMAPKIVSGPGRRVASRLMTR